ncbi:actinorhodin polyketide synthase bifunctional cyclase/dehydratase [Actinokineospora spheciospongiae]|uniref:Actinorhodin polyketide synthase bifunctional cyclase/dehydratase n=1 Tax=Actinokineospora spheciospongiae TaxID=909613 RepID=W7IQY7_9PSEU|nr:aromatase/cyclase [Actinokineospora spheciospongiae]EWC63325.1 actinorhodin polyketide synthase bifunctional cyclase/dehydratase [Actinokineospora spheciospongiae]
MAAQTHFDEHEITVLAPAEVIYGLVADVARWPGIFPPTIHAERLGFDGADEHIRLWALANGEVKSWTSRRHLDPDGLSVRFRQDVSQAPVAAMGGEWVLRRLSERETRIVLKHDYRVVEDDPGALEWVRAAVDQNSRAELEKLKNAVENVREHEELTFDFADSARIAGSLSDVYSFLHEAARWPDRLPHVAALRLREDTPNIQVVAMDTRTEDGTVHTTESVRVCFPERRIVYKQTTVPALMTVHTGEWLLVEDGGEVTATSRHTVSINRAAVHTVLGPDGSVRKAREFVHQALSANSMATLRHAKAFAEEGGHARA